MKYLKKISRTVKGAVAGALAGLTLAYNANACDLSKVPKEYMPKAGTVTAMTDYGINATTGDPDIVMATNEGDLYICNENSDMIKVRTSDAFPDLLNYVNDDNETIYKRIVGMTILDGTTKAELFKKLGAEEVYNTIKEFQNGDVVLVVKDETESNQTGTNVYKILVQRYVEESGWNTLEALRLESDREITGLGSYRLLDDSDGIVLTYKNKDGTYNLAFAVNGIETPFTFETPLESTIFYEQLKNKNINGIDPISGETVRWTTSIDENIQFMNRTSDGHIETNKYEFKENPNLKKEEPTPETPERNTGSVPYYPPTTTIPTTPITGSTPNTDTNTGTTPDSGTSDGGAVNPNDGWDTPIGGDGGGIIFNPDDGWDTPIGGDGGGIIFNPDDGW